jgi:hypothetical protein
MISCAAASEDAGSMARGERAMVRIATRILLKLRRLDNRITPFV